MATRRRGVLLTLLVLALVWSVGAGCTLTASDDDTPVPDRDPVASITPGTRPAPDAPLLSVAWVDGGNLITWTNRALDARRIASGGVIRPFLAPDGSAVAYLRGPAGDALSLWISDVAGASERQFVDSAALTASPAAPRRLNQVVWARAGDRLFFNTVIGGGLDARPADDLWQVDVGIGAVTRLLADGAGGQMTLAPDGARLALAAAGEYAPAGEAGGVPLTIAVYEIASGDRRDLLRAPAVATASQSRWYPALRWLPAGDALRVAIPEPDLVYGQGDTTLWHLPLIDAPQELGTVPADFFGLPRFAPSGAWITYLRRRTAPDQTDLALLLAEADGSGAVEYARGTIGALTPPTWHPTEDVFTFSQGEPDARWLGQPGAVPGRIPTASVTVQALHWLDAQTFVFVSAFGESFTLNLGRRDGAEPVSAFASARAFPVFDAVLAAAD